MGSNDIKCRIIEEELKTFWPEWHAVKWLGGGSFGDVFQIYKESYGIRAESALKVIRMNGILNDLYSSDHHGGDIKKGQIPAPLLNEIRIMEALKGAPNIVAVEDFHFQGDSQEQTLYVRMELLTSFQKLLRRKGYFSLTDILKIGTDICTALTYCEKKKIIHRDIKPANLFVDAFGNYKVGDFGASRQMETVHPGSEMTSIGTISYMAPEVYACKNYDSTVDTYALGLVLYQLLNNRRPPFISGKAPVVSAEDIERANYRRLHGEPIPSIEGVRNDRGFIVDRELNLLVQRACIAETGRRYQNAEEFQEALTRYSIHGGSQSRQTGKRKSGKAVFSQDKYYYTVIRRAGKNETVSAGALIPDQVYRVSEISFSLIAADGDFLRLSIRASGEMGKADGNSHPSDNTDSWKIGIRAGIPLLLEEALSNANEKAAYYLVVTRQYAADRERLGSYLRSQSRYSLLNAVRINSFRELMHYADHNLDIQNAVDHTIQNTSVYPEGFHGNLLERRLGNVIISRHLVLDAARQYAEQGFHTAVLNFANPVTPGGGILQGGQGQEQYLCRMSTLYKSLTSRKAEKYYSANRSLLTGSHLPPRFSGTDQVLYSPDVLILRENRGLSGAAGRKSFREQETYLDKPYSVDIITSSAPFFADRKYLISDDTLIPVFEKRIRNIFESAIQHQVEVIILGAFGCGAFHNPPHVVATAFRNVLTERRYKNAFDAAVFAMGSQKDSINARTFEAILGEFPISL